MNFYQLYSFQEGNRENFTLESLHEMFKMLDDYFTTMPLVPGVLNEPYQRMPVLNNGTPSNNELFMEYKKYKERGQKYKRLHVNCKGWNDVDVLESHPIYPDTDKIGLCSGNRPRKGKLAFISVDVDNIHDFKNKAYGALDVSQWPATLTQLTGGGVQLFYAVDTCHVPLKSKSFLDKGLGVEFIANGRYVLGPGSIHPMTHTIYTILSGYYSPYFPSAALDLSPAPEIILNILTSESLPIEINSTYKIENISKCNLEDYLRHPSPVIHKDQKDFVDINNLNDLVSPPFPSYEDIKYCYDNALMAANDVIILNDFLNDDHKLNLLNMPLSKEIFIIYSIPIAIAKKVSSEEKCSKSDIKSENSPLDSNNTFDANSITGIKENNLVNYDTNFIKSIENKLLSVPDSIKSLIVNPPNIDRSKENEKVLIYLVDHDWQDHEIKYLFDKYPIGDKNREKNNHDKYFEISLYNAKEYVKNKNLSVQTRNDEATPVYGRKSMWEIFKQSSPPQYIIEKILSKSEKLLIAGGKGTLKTTITLQMCIELLDPNTKYFCNHYPINDNLRPKKILYINGENSDDQIHGKLKDLLKDYPIESYPSILGGIITLTKDNVIDFYDDFDNKLFIDYVETTISEENIDLLIFDNFACYNSNGKDENSNASVRPKLNKISSIGSKYKIPVILIHHSGKNNPTKDYAIRGAASFEDWASTVLWIKKENNEKYILTMLKSRNELTDDPLELKCESKKLYSPSGSFKSNNTSNSITEYTLLIEVMKVNNYTFNTQDELKKNLKLKFKENNWKKSSDSYCKSVIDDAVSKGILISVPGQNNSKGFKLNPNYIP